MDFVSLLIQLSKRPNSIPNRQCACPNWPAKKKEILKSAISKSQKMYCFVDQLGDQGLLRSKSLRLGQVKGVRQLRHFLLDFCLFGLFRPGLVLKHYVLEFKIEERKTSKVSNFKKFFFTLNLDFVIFFKKLPDLIQIFF